MLLASSGIEDADGNSKLAEACLTVGSGGISSDVTVTFVLESDSGMGMGLSGYHINSDVFPLEEGTIRENESWRDGHNAPLFVFGSLVFPLVRIHFAESQAIPRDAPP